MGFKSRVSHIRWDDFENLNLLKLKIGGKKKPMKSEWRVKRSQQKMKVDEMESDVRSYLQSHIFLSPAKISVALVAKTSKTVATSVDHGILALVCPMFFVDVQLINVERFNIFVKMDGRIEMGMSQQQIRSKRRCIAAVQPFCKEKDLRSSS